MGLCGFVGKLSPPIPEVVGLNLAFVRVCRSVVLRLRAQFPGETERQGLETT